MYPLFMARQPVSWLFTAACLFLATVIIPAQAPFVCDGQFFVGVNGVGNATLYQMAVGPSGASLAIQPPNLVVPSVNAIGFRKTDHLIYGYEGGKLFSLDKNGNYLALASIAATPGVDYFAGDVSPDGKYYVMVGGRTINGVYQDVEMIKIDLEDPLFGQTTIPISGGVVRSFDIAYDPANGTLYGFDVLNDRIFTLDDETGGVTGVFPASTYGQVAGALFFDGYGDLFSYGTYDSPDKNTLYSIDKNTGAMKVVAKGPGTGGGDGCSCPYTITFSKTVSPDSIYPCSETVYTFSIYNLTGSTLSGISLEDHLPDGFQIVVVPENPLNGHILSGAGTDFLWIENMQVPPGVHGFSITVLVEKIAPGTHKNQAVLKGVPSLFGGDEKHSDDPRTIGQADSTALVVLDLGFEKMTFFDTLCLGDTLWADVSGFGQKFHWQDGSNEAVYPIAQSGAYQVTVTAGCDSATIIYNIAASYLTVQEAAPQLIESGDTATLFPAVFNVGETISYHWEDPLDNSISCLDCKNPIAQPTQNTAYQLTATNEHGCSDTALFPIVLDKTRRVYAPNAFSPNGDGINDTFFLQGKGTATVGSLKVFSRWGALVFEQYNTPLNDAASGWDGTFKGKTLQPGIFAWVAEVVFLDGERAVMEGDVLLVSF
ncbi:MAG: gliding motility-associated C-terminal domain-containing protein [Lewinellaceae bacterium]|nr:gliding motility-associated C-terminal domain-containing protein [Saprospiraceae bacterium]MCB9340771.1 gliding motility-associated C-terminal domain-containing protein [Lewinellaceae bacterium]